jgi:hypothetical protein
MMRLQATAETTISMIFLCMNIKRRLRQLFTFLWLWMKWLFIPPKNHKFPYYQGVVPVFS